MALDGRCLPCRNRIRKGCGVLEMVGLFAFVVYGLLVGFFGYWLLSLVGYAFYKVFQMMNN